MSLLRPKTDRRLDRRTFPEYHTLECVAYQRGHGITWCRHICQPIGEMGECGRLAPHAIPSKTQVAIAAYNAARAEE